MRGRDTLRSSVPKLALRRPLLSGHPRSARLNPPRGAAARTRLWETLGSLTRTRRAIVARAQKWGPLFGLAARKMHISLDFRLCAPYAVCMRLSWPLTGRVEELRSIGAAIADPDSAGILVRGAAASARAELPARRLRRQLRPAACALGCRHNRGAELAFGALSPWAALADGDSLQRVRAVRRR